MSIQLCPVCYQSVQLDIKYCQKCGTDLELFSHKDYAEKLIAALHHPLTEVRMRVILALQLRRQADAVKPLVNLAFLPSTDVIEGLAIVRCLQQIPVIDSRVALKRLADSHPIRAVSTAAYNALL